MVNKTPIDWFSKKQISVESATYGSEFVAARIGTDKIVEMRYELRMLVSQLKALVSCLETIWLLLTVPPFQKAA